MRNRESNMTINTDQTQGCCKKKYTITTDDLPLCCPMTDTELWNAHPRVYLPVEKTGEINCPYCESTYVLLNFSSEIIRDI